MVDAHDQKFTHSYVIRYPEHEPRKSDPHYKDFEAFKRRTKKTAKCAIGEHRNDFSECSGQLELHHHFVEFALQNAIELSWLEKDYPGISDPDKVGAWVESGQNLLYLCERHHRGELGVHVLSSADWEAAKYVRHLVEGDGEHL